MTFQLPDFRKDASQPREMLDSLAEDLPDPELVEAAEKLDEHWHTHLTKRQRIFVDAYLANECKGRLAAIEAGYPATEATVTARELLKKPFIVKAINAARAYLTEKHKLRASQLIEELKLLAFTSMTDLIDPKTAEPLITDPTDPRWRIVGRIIRSDTKHGQRVQYEAINKLPALLALLKILDPSKVPTEKDRGDTTINNYVQTVNLVPVPQGQFIPPPDNVIEHLPEQPVFDQVIDQITS